VSRILILAVIFNRVTILSVFNCSSLGNIGRLPVISLKIGKSSESCLVFITYSTYVPYMKCAENGACCLGLSIREPKPPLQAYTLGGVPKYTIVS
jgi:hypothetical protein